jgi:hypothetical protein
MTDIPTDIMTSARRIDEILDFVIPEARHIEIALAILAERERCLAAINIDEFDEDATAGDACTRIEQRIRDGR